VENEHHSRATFRCRIRGGGTIAGAGTAVDGRANYLLTAPSTVPGGLNDITGNDGKPYPVQSLWSNDSAGGTGYCAGAGDDFPVTG
jgi:hypothetical protein